jgi:hypothetical protein
MLMWDELKGRSWFRINSAKAIENAEKEVKGNGHQ